MIIKEEKLIEFETFVRLLTDTTLKDDAGCKFYQFYRGVKEKNEYILYEKWKNKESLDAHLERLRQLLGPADAGKILSRKLNDCFAETEDIYYKSDEQ